MKTASISEKISKARQQKNMTQAELSQKCHLDIRTVQRIEKGEVSPRAYTLRIINSVLETDFFVHDNNSTDDLLNYRKKFRHRKTLRITTFISAIIFLIMVGIFILFLERHFNLPRLVWAPFVYLIMFAHIIGIALTWRCPGCGGLLGDVFNTRYCSKCGLEFYD